MRLFELANIARLNAFVGWWLAVPSPSREVVGTIDRRPQTTVMCSVHSPQFIDGHELDIQIAQQPEEGMQPDLVEFEGQEMGRSVLIARKLHAGTADEGRTEPPLDHHLVGVHAVGIPRRAPFESREAAPECRSRGRTASGVAWAAHRRGSPRGRALDDPYPGS